ncbi:MAG: hypothetical protein V7K88_09750 [Nostoc sp.]
MVKTPTLNAHDTRDARSPLASPLLPKGEANAKGENSALLGDRCDPLK